jgi:hypothetical protein
MLLSLLSYEYKDPAVFGDSISSVVDDGIIQFSLLSCQFLNIQLSLVINCL